MSKSGLRDFEKRQQARGTREGVTTMTVPEVRGAPEGYEELADVLNRALDQAAYGKGKERHANDKPFVEQPMQVISDMLRSPEGLRYQVIKKTQESAGLPHDRAVAELLGAIVYAAGAVIYMERNRGGDV